MALNFRMLLSTVPRTETIMNVFATDHPMTMNEPCFDRQKHPWLSFVSDVLVSALVLFPFFYGFVLYCALADETQCADTPAFIGSWGDFFGGAAMAFVCCAVVLIPIIKAYRMIRNYLRFRSRAYKQKGLE